MSKELSKLAQQVKAMQEENTRLKQALKDIKNTSCGDDMRQIADKALKQGQSLPIDSVSKCDHEPKRPYKGKYTSCKKCGTILKMKQ